MPTYSYRCTECDNAFDIHQAFTDDALTVCEVCGGRLRKLFNTIGVTFNGSGFYRTDSRSDAASSGASASKTGDGGSGSGSSGSGSGSGGSGGSGSGGSGSGASGSGSSGGGSTSTSTGGGSSASVA